ncbi:MAG: AbrB/MazE/SpoVT family DNA-binding domain-containing protein [Candidatus Hydrothermarchaeaceae archaeon]
MLEDLPEKEWVWTDEWEIEEPTTCPRCNVQLKEKGFDIAVLKGKVIIKDFKKMQCPKCEYVVMTTRQAQTLSDTLEKFIGTDSPLFIRTLNFDGRTHFVRIPKEIADGFNLTKGDAFKIWTEGRKIVLEKKASAAD